LSVLLGALWAQYTYFFDTVVKQVPELGLPQFINTREYLYAGRIDPRSFSPDVEKSAAQPGADKASLYPLQVL